jgi:hypothetical protein
VLDVPAGGVAAAEVAGLKGGPAEVGEDVGAGLGPLPTADLIDQLRLRRHLRIVIPQLGVIEARSG